jgi:hypothetical protein
MLAALLSVWSASADPVDVDVDLANGPEGFGVGLAFGEPSGLSLAVRPGGPRMIQAHASWSLLRDRFRVGADLLQDVVVLHPEGGGVELPIYVGLGVALSFSNDDDDLIGARVPIGLAVRPASTPVDVFLEVAPTMWLLPETHGDAEGVIGFRVYF